MPANKHTQSGLRSNGCELAAQRNLPTLAVQPILPSLNQNHYMLRKGALMQRVSKQLFIFGAIGALLTACSEQAPPEPELSFEESLQQQLIQAQPGDVIEIPAGSMN